MEAGNVEDRAQSTLFADDFVNSTDSVVMKQILLFEFEKSYDGTA